MRIHQTRSLAFVFVLSVPFFCGCSRQYRPLPKWEAQFFKEARRDIFPNDVRENVDLYKQRLVVWTGVITEIEYLNDDTSKITRFTARHHFFDWIEDIGVQRERYFLSPNGEGAFAVTWRVADESNRRFVDQFEVGDFLIAYGYPSTIRNGVVSLYPTQNLRSIKPRLFRTDVLEYGRPGEPTKVLKVAF